NCTPSGKASSEFCRAFIIIVLVRAAVRIPAMAGHQVLQPAKPSQHQYLYPLSMNILLVNRQRRLSIDRRGLKSFTGEALRAIKPLLDKEHSTEKSDVSIVFVGDRAMRRYNRDFRGKDRPTD